MYGAERGMLLLPAGTFVPNRRALLIHGAVGLSAIQRGVLLRPAQPAGLWFASNTLRSVAS